jgi:ankyrin repeat protein
MFSAQSVPGNNLELLSYEQLLSLSISELRQQCELAGLEDQLVDTKDELIALLYNSYNARDNFENQGIILQMDSGGPHRLPSHRENMDNEMLRTLEDLHQMIPFYGQGDLHSDKVVRDMMLNLPQEALDARDSFGNTLIMLACQSRAYDLVQILISRGSDVNSENNDGATCLHFACYIDSLSVNVAQASDNYGMFH